MARERGQVLPLVAALMVMCGLAAIALGRVGGHYALRARAQTAADAAALAGAVEGRPSADRVAAENGGRVDAYRQMGDGDVGVDVDVGGIVGHARARAGPGGELAPAMAAALARAAQVLGMPVRPAQVVPPGLEVVVDATTAARLMGVTDETGLCGIDPIGAPTRFAVCPPPASAVAGSDGA